MEVKSDSEALRKNRSLILVGNVAIAIAFYSSGKSNIAIAKRSEGIAKHSVKIATISF
ncbi:MAG: hypothetical protein V6D39_04365 [Dolichospermum lemmermannii FEM_B0920]